MTIRLLAFGIARDILGSREMTYQLQRGNTIQDLKRALSTQFNEFERLSSLSCAVNTSYVQDDYVLHSNDEVVLIPPVSGG